MYVIVSTEIQTLIFYFFGSKGAFGVVVVTLTDSVSRKIHQTT